MSNVMKGVLLLLWYMIFSGLIALLFDGHELWRYAVAGFAIGFLFDLRSWVSHRISREHR